MKKALTITASVLVLLAVSWKVGTEVFDRKAPCFLLLQKSMSILI